MTQNKEFVHYRAIDASSSAGCKYGGVMLGGVIHRGPFIGAVHNDYRYTKCITLKSHHGKMLN